MVKGTGREERVHSVFWYMKHLTCNLRALRDTTPRLCVVVKLNISHHNTGDRDRCLPVRYVVWYIYIHVCVYTHSRYMYVVVQYIRTGYRYDVVPAAGYRNSVSV